MAVKRANSEMGTFREAIRRQQLSHGEFTWAPAGDIESFLKVEIAAERIVPLCIGGSLHVIEYRFAWKNQIFRALFGMSGQIDWQQAEIEVGTPAVFESRGGGGFVIKHPSEAMTLEERAEQMWRVRPADLDRLGYVTDMDWNVPGPRQKFYLDHLKAAVEQAGG